MPSLDSQAKVQKITLNGYEQDDPAYAEIDLTPFTAEEIAKYESSDSGAEITYDLLASRLKSWNLTVKDAESGQEVAAPINSQTVRKIRAAAFQQLSTLLQPLFGGLEDTEKKS